MAFTEEQLKAINEENQNIIVSAGAGSGKTAVLTQRVIRKLNEGIDIDKILILTFTNEAAAEMKSRIRSSIYENKLDKQLSLLDSAYITTFDSFAFSVVKKYHYILNISPNVSIIDSNIINIYKRKVLNNIFEEYYKNNNELFIKLINDFCIKDDENIKEYIIKLSNSQELLLDKESYINNYILDYYNEDNINNLIIKYLELIKNRINEIKNIYEDLKYYIKDTLKDKLDEYYEPLFNGSKYEDYILITTKTTPRFIGVDELGKEIKEKLVNKTKEIISLLSYKSISDIKDTIYKTKDYIKIILEIINKLDKEIMIYKQKHDTYEFNDIAHFAIKIVKENEEIKEELKNYFNEIMIDEYQDTSIIQETFINEISNNNLYMVGDIKQSIYRFRNANPYIFKEKYNNYSKNINGLKIDLLKNFRSRKETLFNINEIFNIIMDNEIGDANYKEEHNMVFKNIDYEAVPNNQNNFLEIYNYEKDDIYKDYEKEIFIAAEDINKKIKDKYLVFDKNINGYNKLRPVNYSDICIITDRNKYLDTYKKILEYKGIPCTIYKDEILTEDNDILVIKNLIKLVLLVNNNIFDIDFKYTFTSVARSFLFEYKDKEIYEIFENNSFKKNIIYKKCKEIDLNKPLNEIINNIINNFNVYEKLTILNNINSSIIRIKNLCKIAESLNKLSYSIQDFVNYFDEILENKMEITYSVKGNTSNSVKIMNIHKSKGLEFPICYFTGMNNKFTIKDMQEKIIFSEKYGIIIPYMKEDLEDTIIKTLYKENFIKEEISEKIRLLYVALTRCREKMIIITNINKEQNKYNSLIEKNIRLGYRSFLDILNSIKPLEKYIENKEASYTKDYLYNKSKDINDVNKIEKIQKRKIIIEFKEIDEQKYSKKIEKLLTKQEIELLEYGTKIHEELEYKNDSSNWLKLKEKIDNNYINIYKEYEFIYEKESKEYHGIIDLLLEYKDKFIIIDYKLKNIDDTNYLNQLNGYKKYIENISNKKVELYLYSIINNELKAL